MSKGKGGGERGTGGERKGKGKGREGLEGPPISCWHRAPEGLIRHWYFALLSVTRHLIKVTAARISTVLSFAINSCRRFDLSLSFWFIHLYSQNGSNDI